MDQDNTPVHSQGYGPAEHSDDTRQAQHTQSNDTPTDVNCNAVLARSQALTVDIAGRAAVENADRRGKMFDQLAVAAAKGA